MSIGLIAIGAVLVLVVAAGLVVHRVNDVEQANYRVVETDGAIEVRDYPETVVASVIRRGDRRGAVSAGFTPLANYIFAKERAGEGISMTAPVTQSRERIPMTAPVTQSPAGSDASWTVRFVMPSTYTLANLPRPAGDVTLETIPPVRRAVVRFSGVATDQLVREQEEKLKTWMSGRNLSQAGPVTYAYYNAPFTPGFMRRNEVMIDMAPNAGSS